MNRVLLILLAVSSTALGQGALCKHAVVRIDIPTGNGQHIGGSGTVISSRPGRSVILTCAHLNGNGRKIILYVPDNTNVPVSGVNPRWISSDQNADLGLIYVDAQLPYYCPVAPAGAIYSRQCLSVGYDSPEIPLGDDGQIWPRGRPIKMPAGDLSVTMRPAQIEDRGGGGGASDGRTYTRERPWHGRSGGGLIDEVNGWVVGVVSGYSGPTGTDRYGRQDKRHMAEVHPSGRGIYAGHASIVAFLRRNNVDMSDPQYVNRPHPIGCEPPIGDINFKRPLPGPVIPRQQPVPRELSQPPLRRPQQQCPT